MDLIRIYECFCDRTRLRILHLLLKGPLCVCHLEAVLGESQVKISKHLRYLKTHELVSFRREGYWKVYHLPKSRSVELDRNLRCLQDCVATEPVFRRDLARLAKLDRECSPLAAAMGRNAPKAACKTC